ELTFRRSSTQYRTEMAAGRGLNVSALDSDRSEKSVASVQRNLGRGRVSHRRWRQDVEANQSRIAFSIHSRSARRSWSLRASHRDASVETEHTLHAKTLGRDAKR